MAEQFELIHSPEYASILKASQRFVSKSESSLVLTMVLHRADGTMLACDRRRAIIMKNAHGFKNDILINPFTYEAATGKFPDVDKVAETMGTLAIILEQTHIAVWLQIHKSMNQMNKTFGNRTNLGEVIFEESRIKLCVGESEETRVAVELPYYEYKQPEIKKISYNVEFMRDALQVHKDFGTKEMKITIGSLFQPIHMDDQSDRLKVIMLPYKKSN